MAKAFERYRKKDTKFSPGPKKQKRIKDFILPEGFDNSKPVVVIGIDQAITNTGFGCLYHRPNSNGQIRLLSCYGDYRIREDIFVNSIVVKSDSKSKNWPHYKDAYLEYKEKIDTMKKLYLIRMIEENIISDSEIPNIFVCVESIFLGMQNVVKNLIRHQTITVLEMMDFNNINTFVYEYTASEAKESLGNIGKQKDNVTEAVNNIFGTNMPTFNDFVSGTVNKSTYEKYTHISDAIALAYVLMKDILNYNKMEHLFK